MSKIWILFSFRIVIAWIEFLSSKTFCFLRVWHLNFILTIFNFRRQLPKCLGVWISLKFFRIVTFLQNDDLTEHLSTAGILLVLSSFDEFFQCHRAWHWVFHEFDNVICKLLFYPLFTIVRDGKIKGLTNYLLRGGI
jgi:hypothetical protein